MSDVVIRVRARTLERVIFLVIIILLLIFVFYYAAKAFHYKKLSVGKIENKSSVKNITEEQKPPPIVKNVTKNATKNATKNVTSTSTKDNTVEITGKIAVTLDEVNYQKTGTDSAKIKIMKFTVSNGMSKDQIIYGDVFVYDTASSSEKERDYNDYYSKNRRLRLTFPEVESGKKIEKSFPVDISIYHLKATQNVVVDIYDQNGKKLTSIKKTFTVG